MKKQVCAFKICLAILLSICLVGSATINAYAAPFLLLLEAPTFILIAKALICAGLTYLTVTGLNILVNEYWDTCSEDLKAWWNSATTGEVALTDTVWESVRSFVQSKCTTAGEAKVITSGLPIAMNFTDIYGNRVNITSLPVDTNYSSAVIGDNTAGNGKYYAYFFTSWNYYNSGISSSTNLLTVSNSKGVGNIYEYNKTAGTWSQIANGYYGYSFWIGENIYFYANQNTADALNTYNKLLNIHSRVIGYNIANVVAQDAVANPTWDYTNTNTGARTVVLPDGITSDNVETKAQELVNVTYTDLQAETVATEEPENPPTTDTSILNALNGIKDTITTIPTVLGNIRDNIVSIPTAIGNVVTAVQAIPVSIERFFDVSQTLDFEPLIIAGETFTNRFPFSLPWDLYNSFASLAVPGERPDFTIEVPDTNLLKGFKFTVDLSMFEDLLAFAKAVELIIFDIGLILITTKLMGGDT